MGIDTDAQAAKQEQCQLAENEFSGHSTQWISRRFTERPNSAGSGTIES